MIRLGTFVLGAAARRYFVRSRRRLGARPDRGGRPGWVGGDPPGVAGGHGLGARKHDLGTPGESVGRTEAVLVGNVWIRVAASVVGVGLGVALAANLFGWWRLSRTLAEGIILSVLAAFGWIIVVGATSALLPLFVHGPLGRGAPEPPAGTWSRFGAPRSPSSASSRCWPGPGAR